MLFNSYIFLFLFLPLCLGGYYLLARCPKAKPAKLYLTGFSLWFYGYFNPSYLLIMLFSILFNYAFFRLIIAARGEKHTRKQQILDDGGGSQQPGSAVLFQIL